MSSASAAPSGPEQAAVRKLVYQLAELDGEEVDPDETSIVQAANEGIDNLNQLLTRVERLEARVETVEDRAPDPSKKDYDEMDKSDKVTVVRQKLKRTAKNMNGKTAMTYKDVLAIFDGHPSAGHAYDIMRSVGEADGYDYDTNPEGQKRITIDLKKTSS